MTPIQQSVCDCTYSVKIIDTDIRPVQGLKSGMTHDMSVLYFYRMATLTDDEVPVDDPQSSRSQVKQAEPGIGTSSIQCMIKDAVKRALEQERSKVKRSKKRKVDRDTRGQPSESPSSDCESDEEAESESGGVADTVLTDSEDEVAQPLNGRVAEYIDHKLTTRVSKDKLESKLKRQGRPENLKFGQETRINSAIYKKMSQKARAEDKSIMAAQKMSVKAAISGGKVASNIVTMMQSEKPEVQELAKSMYDDIFDCITFACQTSFLLNMKRVSLKNIAYV